MRNTIKYYYDIDVIEIRNENNIYFFENYIFKELNNSFDINLYNFLILNNINIFPIVHNKDGNIITNVNDRKYILLKKNNAIVPLNFSTLKKFLIPVNIQLEKNWALLWQKKIDYFEQKVNTISDRIVLDCFPYYIGLGELAIRIYSENKYPITTSICHDRLNNDIDFLCPDNIILDYSVRDISEFIKKCFFHELIDVDILLYYISALNLQAGDYLILYARLLFPTYYFDCIESKGNLNMFVSKANLYEKFLKEVYFNLNKKVNIPQIDWLIKKV